MLNDSALAYFSKRIDNDTETFMTGHNTIYVCPVRYIATINNPMIAIEELGKNNEDTSPLIHPMHALYRLIEIVHEEKQ